jgi:hypothetical protein
VIVKTLEPFRVLLGLDYKNISNRLHILNVLVTEEDKDGDGMAIVTVVMVTMTMLMLRCSANEGDD